jgi:hypothetical protein
MPDISDVMDVTFEELTPKQQRLLKDAADQFQMKCLMSFRKNRSDVPYLKTEMPRVLMPGEPDSTSIQEKEEALDAFRETAEAVMGKHHTAFLSMFKQMMIGVFGPGMEKMFGLVSPQDAGETSSAQPTGVQPPLRGQPIQPPPQSAGNQPIQPPPQSIGSQPIQPPLRGMGGQPVQPPLQSNGGQPVQQPNPYQPTYGDMAFGSAGVPPNSTYKIAPASNRLQRNMYGGGYHEVMDYGAIDALPNPRYGTSAGMQDDDVLVQKMADLMQNQFGLKPKMQGPAYTPPFPEWYYRVILPPRVKPPTEFTKFSGQDETSTVEHIARYLMQLGEASADEAFRVRYFPLSLTGPAFQWFTSLPPQSVGTWRELEKKFHAHYFSGSMEKKLIDLATLKQRHNETPLEFLRRFREVKGMCFSLTLPDDQLADMAVVGMLPAVREKLFGMEFDNLGQLSQKLSLMSNQAYGFKKDTRFAKHHDIVDIYNQFLEKADQVEDYDDDQEVAAAEIMWGKEPLTVNQRWIKQTKGTYDFDVTKADKLFEFLVKEGRIKLPEGRSMLRPDGVKEKHYCGFHGRNSHSINVCRVFRMRIQRAIQEGHLKFDNKMKLDGHPFPQNMVGFSVNMVTPEEKGKVKVLTSARAKQDGSADPARQVTVDQVRMEAPGILKSQIEVGESSGSKPRVTTRILLNKWQRQQEKERYQKRRYEEERRRFKEEARREELEEYAREQEHAHWGCAFFRHCWNEGLKLPTLKNCPECSDKYFEYRQETVNRRSVHERIGRIHPNDDRHQKIEVIDHPRKRQASQRWADQEEEEHEYIWQEGQWCPPGLRKSQKRRVQRLRNRELKQAGI